MTYGEPDFSILVGKTLTEVKVGDETHQVRAGDLCFFPADVFHSIRVTSGRMKVLIIYAPPYAESPDKVVHKKP